MARIAGVNLPNQKRLEIGLTYIYGIGQPTAQKIAAELGLSPDTKVRDLTDDEVTKLRQYIDENLQVEGDQVQDVSFEGSGCAISKASASMMTQAVKGKSRQEAETLFNEFHRMATGELDEENDPNHLGKLKIFAGVRDFPARVKCATLSWHTMHAALNEKPQVSTE